MNRLQRWALRLAAAGLGIAVLAVIVLQIDPFAMRMAHEVLHRTGLVLMLGGLATFLAASLWGRHRERLRRALRRVAAESCSRAPSAAEWSDSAKRGAVALQYLGGGLMAVAIVGQLLLAALFGWVGLRRSLMVLMNLSVWAIWAASLLGLGIWLAGVAGAAWIGLAQRRSKGGTPPLDPQLRPLPSYSPWSESGSQEGVRPVRSE